MDRDLDMIIEYEVRSSWWTPYVSWKWGQELAGSYIAWKVKRKYRRYKKSIEEYKKIKCYGRNR